ncbi:MAG: AI-2E family transporter, partial [Oricola sp.]|nr:AI-2E family transporter [Oricola sp.]
IGVQFAGFWALLIFVLNYIPIFGAASAITLPVLLCLVQPDGGGVRMALIAAVSLIGAEQVMSNGIEPRIVGRTLNLSPLVVLFSLSVWGALWGFAGLLLSVPITVTVMIVLSQFRSTRPVAIMMSDNGEIAAIKHPAPAPEAA